MDPFDVLGVDHDASEQSIEQAFRAQAKALAGSPNDAKLRILLEARDRALQSKRSVLPVVLSSDALSLMNALRRDIVPHRDFAAQFDQSKKTIFSQRINPLVRLVTLVKVLSICSAILAAFSFETINPYLEILFRPEAESKKKIIAEVMNHRLKQLELELLASASGYERLNSLISDRSDSQKFEALKWIATTPSQTYLFLVLNLNHRMLILYASINH